MAAETRKKNRVPVIILAGVILLGGAAFGLGSYLQHKQIQYVSGIISRMPQSWAVKVGGISGNFFNGEVILKKVSLRLPAEDGPLDLTMDAVAVKGINTKAVSTPGVSRIVDQVAVNNLACSGNGLESAVEHLSITGLRGDVPELARQAGAGYENFDPAKERPAFLDFAVDKALLQNARVARTDDETPVAVTVAAAEANNFSPLKTGPLAARGITIERGGRIFAAIGQAGLDGWRLPGPATVQRMEKLGVNHPLGQNPFGEDVSLDGLRIEAVRLEIPLPGGSGFLPLIIGSKRLSIRFTNEKQSFSSTTANLVVEKKLFKAFGGPRVNDILPLLPETLTANAELSMEIAPVNDKTVEIAVKPFSLALGGLGSLKTSLVMEKDPETLSPDVALRFFDATVTDRGMSDLVFTLLGKKQNKTAEEARRDALITLGVSGVALQGAVRDLSANALDFLEKSGATLSVKLDPGEAIDTGMLGLMILTRPDSAGLSSSLSRPGEKGSMEKKD